jgi:probable phosphoglycerate mutase
MTARLNLPDIYFIRHGQTDWNAQGRYQGRQDIALNDSGRNQAKANGVLLSNLLTQDGLQADELGWHVSPLSRAIETMQIVRSNFSDIKKEVKIEDPLIEVSFGEFEGSLHNDLTSDFSKRGERGKEFWNFVPKNGESYVDLVKRVEPFISKISRPSIIVSHGGIARVFRYLLTDFSKIETVNWCVPQNAILHFSKGKLAIIKSEVD